jgi:hypothetical protein
MKKLIFALVAGSLSIPAMAAQTVVLGPPQFSEGGYANRGQCESALAAERNRQRSDPTARGAGYQDLTGSEFNRESRRTTRCQEVNGRYVVVFNANGF